MTTHADVANLVANAIDGAEFSEATVTKVSASNRTAVKDAGLAIGPMGVHVELTDGTKWYLEVWRAS